MSGRDRGQTTLDFAIGISIFVLVILFVFLFVPNLLEPFNSGSQEETVGVNRVADELSQRILGSSQEPYILNATCTAAFFDDRAPDDCNFESGSIEEQLDLELRNRVNVTVTKAKAIDITDDSAIQCWDDSANNLTTKDSCDTDDGDVVLQRGDSVPRGSSSSISARRIVLLDDRAVSIKVVLW